MIVLCLSTLCGIYVCLFFRPIIIGETDALNEFQHETLYNPIETVDFSHGNNKVIVYTDWKDLQFLPDNINKWPLLQCDDNQVIGKLRGAFVFERYSDDIVETTGCGSIIFFFKDDKLILSGEIIIDGTVSLYFEDAGWTFAVEPGELIDSFAKFKPKILPVVMM